MSDKEYIITLEKYVEVLNQMLIDRCIVVTRQTIIEEKSLWYRYLIGRKYYARAHISLLLNINNTKGDCRFFNQQIISRQEDGKIIETSNIDFNNLDALEKVIKESIAGNGNSDMVNIIYE